MLKKLVSANAYIFVMNAFVHRDPLLPLHLRILPFQPQYVHLEV